MITLRSERVNANFCEKYAQKSSCTQNHGSDAYSVRKKTGLGLNTSQTIHEANDHGKHTNVVKGKLNRLVNPVVKVYLKCVIRFSI